MGARSDPAKDASSPARSARTCPCAAPAQTNTSDSTPETAKILSRPPNMLSPPPTRQNFQKAQATQSISSQHVTEGPKAVSFQRSAVSKNKKVHGARSQWVPLYKLRQHHFVMRLIFVVWLVLYTVS